MPLVSAVNAGVDRNLARESPDLIELPFQGVAVVGVVRAGVDADYEACLVRDSEAGLHPEFIGAVSLPLGESLHFGGMQAVDLALGEPILAEDELCPDHGPLVSLKGGVGHLPLGIPHHPARHDLQGSSEPSWRA